MLKRILPVLAIMFMTVNAMATAVNIDGFGSYLGAGNAKYQFGGGGAISVSIGYNLNVIYRGMYSMAEKNSDMGYFVMKKAYNHMMQLAGVEYVFPIDAARLGWRSSIQVGYSSTQLDTKSISVSDKRTMLLYIDPNMRPAYATMMSVSKTSLKDNGFSLAFWTGLQWQAKQWLAPFFDIGFHKSFYSNSLKSYEIHGLSVMFGIRFTLGHSRNIKSDY